jgi:beta-mannanase
MKCHVRFSGYICHRLLLLFGVLVMLLVFVPVLGAVLPSSQARRSPITGGNSKANCVSLNFPGGVLSQSLINQTGALTGRTYNCVNVFDDEMPTWAAWDNPWMFHITRDGWGKWLAANPAHQVIMAEDLIPRSVSNSNPLTWEKPCASGAYDKYATTLAKNLVSHGAGSIVIRLGPEGNGSWETDYVGKTSAEMSDWSKCFAHEVRTMRAVPGTHFLFVWNPNICIANIPLNKWYPGNSYVAIIGADAYDEDCRTLKTVVQEGWQAYYTDSFSPGASNPAFPSLVNIETFAVDHGKPMSLPEWGVGTGDDDAAYVNYLGRMFNSHNFSYQSYYDDHDAGIAPLGSSIPNATATYSRVFK